MISKLSSIVFVLALALDYKSDQSGGTIWQYVIAGVATFAVALNVLLLPSMWHLLSVWMRRTILLGGLFLVTSVGVAYLHQVPWDNYGRMVLPIFLLFGGFIIAVGVLRRPDGPQWLAKIFLAGAILNAIWSVYTALVVKDLEMATIRFQLSSMGLDMLFAYALARLIVDRHSMWISFSILLVVFTVQALTITRGYVLVWMVLLGVAAYIARRLRRLGAIAPIPAAGVLLTGTVFAVLAVIMLGVLETRYSTLTRWNERIVSKAQDRAVVDVSFALRIAEDRGMLAALSEHPADIFLGRGFGSSFGLDSQYFFSNVSTDLYKGEYLDRVFMGVWQKPDTTWVPIVHDGGIVFLGLFLLFYVQPIRYAWRTLLDPRLPHALRRILLWTVLMMILWITPSLLGNILFLRFTCGIMGMVVAIAANWTILPAWLRQDAPALGVNADK